VVQQFSSWKYQKRSRWRRRDAIIFQNNPWSSLWNWKDPAIRLLLGVSVQSAKSERVRQWRT